MNSVSQMFKKLLPKSVLNLVRPPYHFILAFLGMVVYRNPSQKITVIGVTGTKGKSSVTEIVAHLLRCDGIKVASLSTIQFSIDGNQEPNLFKMTMPGRFFVQKFLRKAVKVGCTHAVIEMTSEGAKQFRHQFIQMDGLIFTNLTPEHIESHGSFENYKNAKLSIAKRLQKSKKRPRFLVANLDDEHGKDFLNFEVEEKIPYSLKDLTLYTLQKDSVTLLLEGRTLRAPLIGLFNVYNVLASIKMARALGVELDIIESALNKLAPLKGRVEKFVSRPEASKKITAIVDYAHTPDSLTKLYEAFPDKYKVCVLGNTGGGRDTWKRPEMGVIAEKYCDQIILTNEDPYDENPLKIVEDMKKDMSDHAPVEIIMDRKKAIKTALERAPENSYVLISGKGTDPYIMGPKGTKQKWSDAETVKELLAEMD